MVVTSEVIKVVEVAVEVEEEVAEEVVVLEIKMMMILVNQKASRMVEALTMIPEVNYLHFFLYTIKVIF